jgi:ElaB/YqjD/DUF883 family membrane-anchored ribosome-binding protein
MTASTRSTKKAPKRAAKAPSRKTKSAQAVVAHTRGRDRAVATQASTVFARTRRFVKRNPVRVLLGASAVAFVLSRLGRLV